MRALAFFGIIVILAAICPNESHAYVDPFAGQTLFRFLFPLLAGLIGTSVFLKKRLASVKNLMGSVRTFITSRISRKAG